MIEQTFANIKYKYFTIFLLAFILICTGCRPKHYTDELLTQVNDEYISKTTEWFQNNHPEYNARDLELVYNDMDITNLVSGTLTCDGKDYSFVFNADDGMLYTNRNYDVAVSYAEELIEEQLPFSVKSLEISTFCRYKVPYTQIQNQTGGAEPKETEVTYVNGTYPFEYLPMEYTEEDAKNWASSILMAANDGRNTAFVRVYLADYDTVANAKGLYSIMSNNPGIGTVNFYVQEKKDEEYYVMFDEEKNRLFHYYKLAEHNWEYDEIKLK